MRKGAIKMLLFWTELFNFNGFEVLFKIEGFWGWKFVPIQFFYFDDFKLYDIILRFCAFKFSVCELQKVASGRGEIDIVEKNSAKEEESWSKKTDLYTIPELLFVSILCQPAFIRFMKRIQWLIRKGFNFILGVLKWSILHQKEKGN